MEERGFIFAYVPKVACTGWKSLIRRISGYVDWLDNELAHDKANGGLRYLDSEGPDAGLLLQKEIKKFAMVREPYSRALSAYLNKIEPRLPPKKEPRDHFDRIVVKIEAWRLAALDLAEHHEITFEVFLLWLSDSGSWLAHDEHFASQTMLLRQPEVAFDIIGRFEDFSRASGEIMAAMGWDEQFPNPREQNFSPTGASSKVHQYFNASCYKLVDEIYKDDFHYFKYLREIEKNEA